MKSWKLVTLAAACAVLAACNPQKGPADLAIKGADEAIAASSGEAKKFVPQQLKEAKDAIQAAKDQFAAGDFQKALETATGALDKAKGLAAAAIAKKDELTKGWGELSGSVPQMLESAKAKLEELGKAKKLPKELDKAKLAAAQGDLTGLKATWDEAAADFGKGDMMAAIEKAKGVKEKAGPLMATLGIGAPAK